VPRTRMRIVLRYVGPIGVVLWPPGWLQIVAP
jgi:hypothetical protein